MAFNDTRNAPARLTVEIASSTGRVRAGDSSRRSYELGFNRFSGYGGPEAKSRHDKNMALFSTHDNFTLHSERFEAKK